MAGQEIRYFCCITWAGGADGISTCQRVTTSSAAWYRCSPTAAWRHNFAGGRNIEVTLRGVRQPAEAVLCDDPDEVAEIYERLIEDLGTDRAARRLGLRFNVDRAPTRDELKDCIRRSGLSIVRVYPHPQPAQKPDK